MDDSTVILRKYKVLSNFSTDVQPIGIDKLTVTSEFGTENISGFLKRTIRTNQKPLLVLTRRERFILHNYLIRKISLCFRRTISIYRRKIHHKLYCKLQAITKTLTCVWWIWLLGNHQWVLLSVSHKSRKQTKDKIKSGFLFHEIKRIRDTRSLLHPGKKTK